MSVFFLGSWGINRSEGQKSRVNRKVVLRRFVYCFIPHEPRKRHTFFIFTMPPTKTLSKILREKLKIPSSKSNRDLISFYVFINVRVICPTVELLFDSGYPALN